MRFSSIIAPYWTRVDLGRSFTNSISKVYYHIYTGQGAYETLSKATSDVLSVYQSKLPEGKTFQASWVCVVTWVNLRPADLNDFTETLVRLKPCWSLGTFSVSQSNTYENMLLIRTPFAWISCPRLLDNRPFVYSPVYMDKKLSRVRKSHSAYPRCFRRASFSYIPLKSIANRRRLTRNIRLLG